LAIFRCYLCDDVFDISEQYTVDVGFHFCGKCHHIYKEKLVTQLRRVISMKALFTEEPPDKDEEPELIDSPKQKKRKKKAR
jgi:hypothetical protein